MNLWIKQNAELKQIIWNREGSFGKKWRLGEVTIQSPDAYFQVVFEGLYKLLKFICLTKIKVFII